MRKKELYQSVITHFQREMPVAETELIFDNPFQLLIAVILSAQCTDKRVNQITPGLWAKYPTPESMAEATEEEILSLIKSVSYPNSKARYLSGTAKMIVQEYHGEVPSTGEELERMPGVGRKTANVIQSVIFQKAKMAVDTHVQRVSRRIGLVTSKAKTPRAIERELTTHIPEELIPTAHHWLILHGRYVCKARKPLCERCGLNDVCRFYCMENPEKSSE